LEARSLSSSFTLRWLVQAILGAILVILLGVHLIVNHWVAPQGLLTYADVVNYYDIPGIGWKRRF
jgi:succinate dehydrogenase hydrophobic anchor subunit